jgi:hypothetical protein
MLVTRISPFTKKEHSMELPVTQAQFDAWEGGELIQVAFSNLNQDQREFIKTGVTPEEYANAFAGFE